MISNISSQDKLKNSLEKTVKPGSSKKRKFDPLVSSGEKDKSLKILESISNKRPKLDVGKAVGSAIHEEESQRGREKGKGEMHTYFVNCSTAFRARLAQI